MARLPRVVALGHPHHITQRGVARQEIFTSDKSRQVYLTLLNEHAQRHRLSIIGYCLMSNHVHLLAIPHHPDSLAATFRYAHGRFAQYANAERCRSGHFWQNRFYSCPVEDSVVGAVLAYIELNPVRARLSSSAAAYEWSSAAVHLNQYPDTLGILDLRWWNRRWSSAEWATILHSDHPDADALHRATYTGRPLGSTDFVTSLEQQVNRKLCRSKGGRPKRQTTTVQPAH